MKYFYYTVILVFLGILCVAGFRGKESLYPPIEIFPDMDRQPKYKPQAKSDFFKDKRTDRMPISGTIPLEVSVQDSYLNTGKMGDRWGNGFPIPITIQTMEKGRERFNINCAVCHGATGSGNGIATEYGLVGAANFHTDRIRNLPDGQIYDVIVHGKGQMEGYPQINIEDRWAIVAYMRALQLSMNATLNDVPDDKKGDLNPYE